MGELGGWMGDGGLGRDEESGVRMGDVGGSSVEGGRRGSGAEVRREEEKDGKGGGGGVGRWSSLGL